MSGDQPCGGRLAGRIALITGASRGLGAAVAERYAAEGAHVVLVARTVGGLEAVDDRVRAAGGTATLVPADLTKPGQVEALGAAMLERFGRIDVLVANAADLGALGPVAHSDPKVWRQTLELNLWSVMRTIQVMHPLLRRSAAGRALFVTCSAGTEPTAYWNAYAVSKAGLEMMVQLYAAETAKTAIRANLIDPGPLATRLRATAFPGEDPSTLPDPASVAEAFVRLAGADWVAGGRRVDAPRLCAGQRAGG
ncbi:MAG: SDR family NAD(P)-dependent oxidoreductase [Rhodospirillaceae bacterium]|nr:SDR family NAD(P)-dependent oxidoreductase [Rhodospirillaceae bacterium]